MNKIIYFTPHSTNSSDASGIRARYIITALNEKFLVDELHAGPGGNFFFKVPSNKSSLVKRLIGELLLGLELGSRFLYQEKENLFILSSPPFVSILICSLFLRLFKRKYILDIRDIYPEVYFHLGLISSESILGKVLKFLVKKSYEGAHKIVTVTKGLKSIIESYGIQDVGLIYNGYDKDVFYLEENKYEEFTVLFHGNLAKMQNIDALLQVAESLQSDIKVLVVGDGPQADKLINNKRIDYLGRVPYEKIPEIVRKSHVGISLRHDGVINETAFPVKIFEYMGACLPIISTPLSEAGRFLEENKLGYQFGNHEINKIVEKIHFIRNNYKANPYVDQFSRQLQAQNFVKYISDI